MRAWREPWRLPGPWWRPFRLAASLRRVRAFECTIGSFLMMKPSLIRRRTSWPVGIARYSNSKGKPRRHSHHHEEKNNDENPSWLLATSAQEAY